MDFQEEFQLALFKTNKKESLFADRVIYSFGKSSKLVFTLLCLQHHCLLGAVSVSKYVVCSFISICHPSLQEPLSLP